MKSKYLIILIISLILVGGVIAFSVIRIDSSSYSFTLSDNRVVNVTNISSANASLTYNVVMPDKKGIKMQDLIQMTNYLNALNTINTTILSNSYLGYTYGMVSNNYNIYFLSNSNLDSPMRFERNGYFFVYDISQGQLTWIGQSGQPSATATLGSGASSNSLDTVAVVNGNKIIYPNAFYNTNTTYELLNGMVKETFVLAGLPSFKDYYYLQYSGNIKFNSSLSICTDIQCFNPSGSQDDFETSGKIYFKDSLGNTVFSLKEPIIYDSNGVTTLGIYSVHGSNAQMNFWLRINSTWLKSAKFPVYIDPSTDTGISNNKVEKTTIKIN